MKKIVCYLFLCLALFACHDVKKQNQLDKMDTLTSKIDDFRNTWNDAKIDDLSTVLIQVKAVLKDINKKNQNADTIDVELAQKLEDYKFISSGLTFVVTSNDVLKKNIYEASQSVELLTIEIANGEGDRSKYNQNILFEEKKVKQLGDFLQKNLETKTICLNSYRKLHAEMKAYSISK